MTTKKLKFKDEKSFMLIVHPIHKMFMNIDAMLNYKELELSKKQLQIAYKCFEKTIFEILKDVKD